MNILDAANAHHSRVIKVLFIRIHDDGRGKNVEEFVCCWEITLQMLGNTLDCVLFEGNHHFSKKLIPFILICASLNDKLFFPIMRYKGRPQFLCMRIDIFTKKQHYGHPNIVRCNLDISMIDVCLVKGFEKSIFMFFG